MNSPNKVTETIVRILFALLVIAIATVLLFKARSRPAAARTQTVPPAKRLFENRVPEHLPIRVKIRREKEKLFRDLDNENWARDFELEVKNTGEKPIYYLVFALGVPDAKIANSYQTFVIAFGRVELSDLNNRPAPDDIPIRPDETKVLKIEDVGVRGWDEARARAVVPRRIRGAKLIFQDLRFGDRTGVEGSTGSPRPTLPTDTQGN